MKKFIFALILAVGFVITASAQDLMESDSGVNSTDLAIYGNVGIGYGPAIYGVGLGDSADVGEFYQGNGIAFHMGAMVTWKYLALSGLWQYAGAKELEDSDGNPTGYEDYSYNVLDLSLGLIFAREPGDMGYSILYGGLRYWGTKVDAGGNAELSGVGWSLGIRDLSTFSFGGAALALQTGLLIDMAPINDINGNKPAYDYTSFGLGFEVGLGVALEDMGLLVMVLYRLDVVANAEDKSATGSWYAAGIGNYSLSVTYQFDI